MSSPTTRYVTRPTSGVSWLLWCQRFQPVCEVSRNYHYTPVRLTERVNSGRRTCVKSGIRKQHRKLPPPKPCTPSENPKRGNTEGHARRVRYTAWIYTGIPPRRGRVSPTILQTRHFVGKCVVKEVWMCHLAMIPAECAC